MFAQIAAVVAMNIRSIPQRLWMSLATVLAVAVVVAVLLAFLALGNGFRATLDGSGSEHVAVLMRTGSQTELNSIVTQEQVNLIRESAGVAADAEGPLISAELYVVVDGKKRGTDSDANLPFRGLGERGLALRDQVRIVEGRMFEPGRNEIVIGEAVLREFAGFDLGSRIRLGRAEWQVVGVFSAGGSVFDSELWGDARTLQTQFDRGNTYQIIRARLQQPGEIAALVDTVASDLRLNLDVKTEKAYYQEQSQSVFNLIFYIGWPLAIVMALGALAGALNTMYNSVAQRAGEIATLRAIGFPGMPVFCGTLVESLLLSAVGGVLGALVAFAFFDGISTSTLGNSFTQIVFRFELSSAVVINGLILALIIGLIGGFFPALRAARLPVLRAFAAAA